MLKEEQQQRANRQREKEIKEEINKVVGNGVENAVKDILSPLKNLWNTPAKRQNLSRGGVFLFWDIETRGFGYSFDMGENKPSNTIRQSLTPFDNYNKKITLSQAVFSFLYIYIYFLYFFFYNVYPFL